MTLDRGQQIRMSLGGTQGLPAPGPAIGTIQWAEDSKKRNDDSLVEITFEKSTNHAIIWTVRVGDLKAIESKTKVDAKKKKIAWFVGSEVMTALESGTLKGVAYVGEEAQTLVRLEHGVSVIDSIQVAAGLSPNLSRETDDDFKSTGCKPC